MTREYISITDTAKIVRAELKRAFPTVKFSVRCNQYSMGCHLSVCWVDGPNEDSVREIADRYYGTGFDSMTDSTTHHDSEYQGRMVHFSGSRPHCDREISADYEAKCGQAWEQLSEIEQLRLTTRRDFPCWPEDRPGRRLASFLSAPSP